MEIRAGSCREKPVHLQIKTSSRFKTQERRAVSGKSIGEVVRGIRQQPPKRKESSVRFPPSKKHVRPPSREKAASWPYFGEGLRLDQHNPGQRGSTARGPRVALLDHDASVMLWKDLCRFRGSI